MLVPHLDSTGMDWQCMHRVEGGAQVARHDVPFLFKAFETGQMRPPRPGSKAALQPRASTIHEYLDWTFMAVEGADEDDLVGTSSQCN